MKENIDSEEFKQILSYVKNYAIKDNTTIAEAYNLMLGKNCVLAH